MPMTIAGRLKERLREKGIARLELARRLGESDRNLENWLNGKARMPAEFLLRFIEEVPTDANWLVTGQGTPDPVPESLAAYRLRLVREALDAEPPAAKARLRGGIGFGPVPRSKKDRGAGSG